MKSLLIPILLFLSFQSIHAIEIDPIFIGKWADSKPSCRGIINNDEYKVLTIRNSDTNQIRDARYEGHSYINLLNLLIPTLRNELQAIAMIYSFSDEDPETIYKDSIQVDYTIIENKLYSINRYTSEEDGTEQNYTLSYIKCN